MIMGQLKSPKVRPEEVLLNHFSRSGAHTPREWKNIFSWVGRLVVTVIISYKYEPRVHWKFYIAIYLGMYNNIPNSSQRDNVYYVNEAQPI